MSKRKLHELIFKHHVRGWDDPRILTINGMRRRGYPSEAINNFCDSIGVTRRGNENYIHFGVLEN
jgi:glutaminyl-tRNA synthetase